MGKYRNIPPEIARKLDQSVRRVRRIVAFRGACATLAAAVASLLATMAVDAMVTIFSSWVRWGLWACGVAATSATAYLSLVKPLSRRFTAGEIAALIERNHPELEERLSTVVELAEQGDAEMSGRLVEALVAEAVKDAGAVSPRREFTSRTVKPLFVAAALAILVLGALFVAFPSATRRLATRALVPSAEVDNIYASSMRVAPGDAVLQKGSPLTVSLAVDGGFPSRAFVRTRPDGKGEAVERMTRTDAADGGRAFYEFSYPQVDRSFTYRMNCGSGLTRGYRVEVVDEPSFSGRVIEIEHPAYTGRPGDSYTNRADIVGLAGSKVTVTVVPSRAGLEGLAALPGGRTVPAEKLADGRFRFSFPLAEGDSGPWGVMVWDSNGFSNKVESASLSVVRDAPPEVRLVQPESAELKLPAFGEMPLDFEVKEDFGLSKVVLEMCVGPGEWEEAEELQVSRTGGVTWSGDRIVRFAGRDFGKAGAVRFRVKAQDTLPADMGGPGTGLSPEIVVNLVSKNTSVARQELWEQISSANKGLDEIRKFLDRAAGHMGSAAKSFPGPNSWSAENARKVLGWAKGDVVNAEKMLSDFVDGLRGSRLESAVDLFAPVLEKFLTPTRRDVEDVFLMSGNEEKGVACAKCRVRIQECIAELDRARRRFADLTKAAVNVQKLEDYAERMKALEEMAEEGDIEYDELAKRERELEQKFKEDFADEINKNLARQKKQAEHLQKRGEELAARQEALEKQAAEAKNGTDEQKKSAAAAEKKLADDINRLAAQTADLARQVEERAGSDANDDNHTAKPEWEAHSSERKAAAQAQAAADKMKDGDFDGSRENSQAVKDALQAAQDKLAEAKDRMEAKEGELAQESKEYRDMAKALHDAAIAADAAAKEQAEMAAEAARQQGENQKQGDQQQQGQQQRPQTEAQQKAGQAAKSAAGRLKNKAQANADRYNLPMDRFESEDSEPGDSESGDGEAKPADGKSADQQNGTSAGRERRRRKERVERREPQDDGGDGEDWFKMKSESGAGADADAMSDVPEEYRALVREYFNALDKGGAK